MVRIEFDYQGDLHCETRHAPSGTILSTDAPADNEGRGASFSPTDLVATALGSCILTTMGIAARREGIDLAGSRATVDKEMTAQPPRRIARLVVKIEMSIPRSADPKGVLESIAHACPVSRSLHPEVKLDVTVNWAG